MRTAWELYFEFLASSADEQNGSVDEGGHFALLTDGLEPLPDDDNEIKILYCELDSHEREMLTNNQAAIVSTNDQGFLDIQLYATDGEARGAWDQIESF